MLRNQTNAAKLEVDNKQLRGQIERFTREKEAKDTNVKQLIAANEKLSGQLQGSLEDSKFLKQLKANLEKKEKKPYRKYNPWHVRYDEF